MQATTEDYMYGRWCIKCNEALDSDDHEGTCCPVCGAMLTVDLNGGKVPIIPLRRKDASTICGVR